MIFLSYFKNHRWLFAADVTCAVGIAAIDLLFPLVTRSALYEMLPNHVSNWKKAPCTNLS